MVKALWIHECSYFYQYTENRQIKTLQSSCLLGSQQTKKGSFPTLLITYTSLISSPPFVNINAVNNKAQPSHAGNVTHIKIKVQVLIPNRVWSSLWLCGYNVTQGFTTMINSCSDRHLTQGNKKQPAITIIIIIITTIIALSPR